MNKKNLLFSKSLSYNNMGQIFYKKSFLALKTIFYYSYVLKGL
jgi:hypothetical protein